MINLHQSSVLVHHTHFDEIALSNQESEMLPACNTIEVKSKSLITPYLMQNSLVKKP
jgi:hypothetical protein